jgi:hypothetical protein
VLFWSAVTFPVVCFGTSILAWVLYREQRLWWAFAVMLLPLINIAIVMIWMATSDGKIAD